MANNRTRTATRLKATFGFKSIPFTKDLDPDRLFSTEMMTKALDRIRKRYGEEAICYGRMAQGAWRKG